MTDVFPFIPDSTRPYELLKILSINQRWPEDSWSSSSISLIPTLSSFANLIVKFRIVTHELPPASIPSLCSTIPTYPTSNLSPNHFSSLATSLPSLQPPLLSFLEISSLSSRHDLSFTTMVLSLTLSRFSSSHLYFCTVLLPLVTLSVCDFLLLGKGSSGLALFAATYIHAASVVGWLLVCCPYSLYRRVRCMFLPQEMTDGWCS